MLVLPARLESNIRMAAMIGIGDTAIPTANGSRSPITEPMNYLISSVSTWHCTTPQP